MININIPKSFREDILKLKGDEGEVWLEQIPETLENFARKWNLSLDLNLPKLSFNFIVYATNDKGEECVLKLYFPDLKEFLGELEALKIFNGEGAARLLKYDEKFRVMLLERLMPGKELKSLGSETSEITAAAQVMRDLWKGEPEVHQFPDISDWYRGFARLRDKHNGKTGPLPEKLVLNAEKIFDKLISTSGEQMLLHGDLHYGNILSTKDKWKAIDPKGLIGEREYEVGALLRNPMPEMLGEPNLKEILTGRIKQFSEELKLDPRRIHDWAIYQAVLSAIWGFEDFKNLDKRWIEIAEVLDELEI